MSLEFSQMFLIWLVGFFSPFVLFLLVALGHKVLDWITSLVIRKQVRHFNHYLQEGATDDTLPGHH